MSDPLLPPPSGRPGAGAGIRFGARFIDGLVLIIPIFIVLRAVLGFEVGGFAYGLFASIIQLGYYTIMESNGATVGKRVLGLRVQGPDGGTPTQQQAFTRNAWLLLGLLPGAIGVLASVGVAIWIAVAIGQSGRGPHDGWAGGTLVVKG